MKQKQKDLPRLRDTRTAYTIPTFPDEASRHTHTHSPNAKKERKNGVATSLGSVANGWPLVSLVSRRHVLSLARVL